LISSSAFFIEAAANMTRSLACAAFWRGCAAAWRGSAGKGEHGPEQQQGAAARQGGKLHGDRSRRICVICAEE
jgi:hypothetical protein